MKKINMSEEEKDAIYEFKKELRLATNIDDITTEIRNEYAEIILNLIEKQEKEIEQQAKEIARQDRNIHKLNLDKIQQQKEIEELKEYKWMYEDLCK